MVADSLRPCSVLRETSWTDLQRETAELLFYCRLVKLDRNAN